MRWLYRLQARLGLSGPEGTAALAVLLALTGGTVAHHLQATSDPLPADVYAAADAAFAPAPGRASAGDTSAAAAPLLLAGPAASGLVGGGAADGDPASDSTAAQVADAAVETAAAPRRSGKPPPAPTNVNTASAAELQRLPGIGPALAGRIVEHRRAQGRFRTAEQLADVKGIGDKTLEKLRPWVRL